MRIVFPSPFPDRISLSDLRWTGSAGGHASSAGVPYVESLAEELPHIVFDYPLDQTNTCVDQ